MQRTQLLHTLSQKNLKAQLPQLLQQSSEIVIPNSDTKSNNISSCSHKRKQYKFTQESKVQLTPLSHLTSVNIKCYLELLENDTKIRFKQSQSSEEQEILNQYRGVGTYKFQKIFQPNSTQKQVYEKVAIDLIDSAIEGYNGTIFAYGQTGSGKTYTMTGGDGQSEMGIIPRVINDLFTEAQTRDEEIHVKIRYMQIYNKHGYDLLAENISKKLEDLPKIKPFSKGETFQFEGLSEHDAPNFQEAIKLYQTGQNNRIVRKTPNNDQSSRSHCILMINVRTKNKETGLQQKATINLVDLAGSQRVHNTQEKYQKNGSLKVSPIFDEKMARQGININLGLYYLSRVVISLGQQAQGNSDIHVPYRDSLLTMALKSSMGGNCKTRMIATMNPNPQFTPQNVATCRFSQNLLVMENKLKKNVFINPWDIIKGLKNEVEELKGQIQRLKGQEVKQVLERNDYIEIHRMIDDFIEKDNPPPLPINDRLFIREYLNYMRNIIRSKGGKPNVNEVNKVINESDISEMRNLKNQLKQKQNEIQLLLSIINHKKQENPEEMDDNLIAVEEVSEHKIAQTVVNTLSKGKKKQSQISIQDVEKKLIKPMQFNEDESPEEVFQKFKDSHMKKEEIEDKDYKIKLKQMKKDVLLKKIKMLKCSKASIMKKMANEKSLQSIFTGDCQNADLKAQLEQIDDKLKKRYQQLKSMQFEIGRLDLCKNKNQTKLKTQFDVYMQKNSRKQSQEIQNEQKIKPSFKDGAKRPDSARKSSENQELQQEMNKKEGKNDQVAVNKHLQDFYKQRKRIYKDEQK